MLDTLLSISIVVVEVEAEVEVIDKVSLLEVW
jgi:hypothetical protein